VPGQGIKAFIYHMLFFLFGPPICLVLVCFDNTRLLKNMAFLPSNSMALNQFFILQTVTWLALFGANVLIVKDSIEAALDDDSERV